MPMTTDIYYKIINRASEEEERPESSRHHLHRKMHSEGALYGKMSVMGRQRSMEDAIDVRLELCRPEISHAQPIHFFGVFDGHDIAHIAAACSLQMHEFVRTELMRVGNTSESEEGKKEQWRTTMRAAFLRMDQVAMEICICGRAIAECGGCRHIEVVHAGSTTLVAVLTPEHIVVSNCGNSRAVLCRGGRAISLSHDHKPDREDELARIVAAGGRVVDADGPRVEGILPMSRAIELLRIMFVCYQLSSRDKYFKPIVTPEPETTVTDRNQEDECLILASDDLWNEISIDLACRVASTCLREGGISSMDLSFAPEIEIPSEANNQMPGYPSSLAATLLSRIAIGCNSTDNISVVVIDLRKM